ncbi:GNAT family N-acetyltransferase [Clostridium algidicarnis]|nr:GNAT family N-acetyltransferase [Clostridium algidicarnis]MBU3219554.1 GNAT family N-acetyltransferase [Clostridium algidicarnis]
MMCKIYNIDSNSLTIDEVENLYLINKSISKKYKFLDPYISSYDYKALYLSSFNGIANELFVLEKNSLIYGMINCGKAADCNGNEQYKLNITLCDLPIDELMLKAINQLVQEKLAQHGEIVVVTYNHELNELINQYNNKVSLRANYYTLKREDIDIDMLNKYMKELEAKTSDLSIKYTDIISEDYIKQFCDLFTETMKDMPDVMEEGYIQYIINPEKQRQINESNKKRNITHNCYMIFNSNDEMIAKSNVSVNNNHTRFPYQFMIGVKRSYRGRNLGKWLYASMYKTLFETINFDRMLVSHHPANKHAINVSEWVGYKLNYLMTTHILYK